MLPIGIYSVYRNGKWVYYKTFFDGNPQNGLHGLGPSSFGPKGDMYGPTDKIGLTPDEAAYKIPPFAIKMGKPGNFPIGKIACGPSLGSIVKKTAMAGGILGLLYEVIDDKTRKRQEK